MFPKSDFSKRILVSISFGLCVALLASILDVLFARAGIAPATTVLNDLIIGAAVTGLVYSWMTRQVGSHKRDLTAEQIR
ncbi:MAG: hypothetical protein ACRD4Y_00265, partial [Candidatus Acidiferrales bacterium]